MAKIKITKYKVPISYWCLLIIAPLENSEGETIRNNLCTPLGSISSLQLKAIHYQWVLICFSNHCHYAQKSLRTAYADSVTVMISSTNRKCEFWCQLAQFALIFNHHTLDYTLTWLSWHLISQKWEWKVITLFLKRLFVTAQSKRSSERFRAINRNKPNSNALRNHNCFFCYCQFTLTISS